MLACAYSLQHNSPTPFERLLRRDRAIVSIALLILILSAWLYVGRLADGVALKPGRCAEFACLFLMWAAMMMGMMLPSATPMVLRYAWIDRASAFDTDPIAPTGWFAGGYL